MHDPAPDRPARGNERWILLGAFLFGLAALVAIVAEDYEPVKLAPVFVLLSWFPRIALHELGHAIAAGALGWEVREVVIGFGGTAARFEILGVPCSLKMYPLGGYVRPAPLSLSAVRVRSALVYLAGPGAELLLVALLVLALGWDTMTTRTDEVGIIAAQAVAVAALIGAFSNLVPRTFPTERGLSATDGMGILRSFTQPARAFVAQVRSAHEERIVHASHLADPERTVQACEHAFGALGDEPHLRTVMIRALVELDADLPDLEGRELPASVVERVRQRSSRSARSTAARSKSP